MKKAAASDKLIILDILSKSFDDNKSVNYIIKQDSNREERARKLMEYAFKVCNKFGEVYLSDEKDACALIVYPDKKRATTTQTILWDLKLITSCTGIANIKKALLREAKIKRLQAKGALYYLWFIGVDPAAQNKGIGSALLKELIEDANEQQRTVCLETSTEKNLSWYQKHGFEIYNELDLGYRLYFLKKEADTFAPKIQ